MIGLARRGSTSLSGCAKSLMIVVGQKAIRSKWELILRRDFIKHIPSLPGTMAVFRQWPVVWARMLYSVKAKEMLL